MIMTYECSQQDLNNLNPASKIQLKSNLDLHSLKKETLWLYNDIFFSPPVLMHGGLVIAVFCLNYIIQTSSSHILKMDLLKQRISFLKKYTCWRNATLA